MYKYLFVQLFLLCSIYWAHSQQTIENGPVIKVLTFNILHGRTMNGDFDLDKIAQVIINADPDLVALQEVDYKTNRAKKYDLATELGWRAKMAPIFGRAMYYDGGEYGEAVLSKYTIINSRNIGLPHLPDSEPRAALEITTVLPSGDTISFIGSHLDHLKVPTDRVQQVKEINRVFKNNKYPTILAGDLNDVPGSESMNILESIWKASYDALDPDPTFPSDGPVKKIDYVLFLPQHHWKVLDKKVVCDLIASDHCGYLVTLQLIKD